MFTVLCLLFLVDVQGTNTHRLHHKLHQLHRLMDNSTILANQSQLVELHNEYVRYYWIYPPCNINSVSYKSYCYDSVMNAPVSYKLCHLHQYRHTSCTDTVDTSANNTSIPQSGELNDTSPTPITLPSYIPSAPSVTYPPNIIIVPSYLATPPPYTGRSQLCYTNCIEQFAHFLYITYTNSKIPYISFIGPSITLVPSDGNYSVGASQCGSPSINGPSCTDPGCYWSNGFEACGGITSQSTQLPI